MKLSYSQQAVVDCYEHCLAVACPGSGKTATLVAKSSKLLLQGHYVAAVTFTHEAAENLARRIQQNIGENYCEKLIVGTFHSLSLMMAVPSAFKNGTFGKQILARIKSPFHTRWKLATGSLRLSFVDSALNETGLNLSIDQAISLIEKDKNNEGNEPDSSELRQVYDALLAGSECIDFQDILININHYISQGKLKALPVNFLLVDEFQDTDDIQYRWIEHHIAAKIAVTVVGDDDQSIYGFRRALGYEAMQRFVQQCHACVFKLENNYRCRKEISDCAQLLIRNNLKRMPKMIVAKRGSGGRVCFFQFETEEQQAQAIAKHAKNCLKQGKQLTVISRVNRSLKIIADACKKMSVPFLYENEYDLMQTLEGGVFIAVIHLFKCFQANEFDTVLGWLGFRVPQRLFLRSCCVTEIQQAFEQIQSTYGDFESIHAWQKLYEKYCSDDDYDYERITIDVHMYLIAYAKTSLTVAQKKRLEHVAIIIRRLKYIPVQTYPTKNTPKNIPDIRLMTAHASKGLEFDCVWIINTNDRIFPSYRSSCEEERRLMYVAMTRAKEVLTVSCLSSKDISIFLNESGIYHDKNYQKECSW